MREYETAFIVQPEISDEGCQELCTRLDGILEKNGAVRLMLEDWGKRKLAYEIQKFQKGQYYFLSYVDDGTVVPEIERSLRLDESVLRYLTVKVADSVPDIAARKAEAAEKERIQQEKAAERAAREAEAEAARAEAEAEEVRARAEAKEARGEDDDSSDEDGEASLGADEFGEDDEVSPPDDLDADAADTKEDDASEDDLSDDKEKD